MNKPITHHVQGIKCDAPGCGWRDDEAHFDMKTYGAEWLGVPCPKCGSNLYTEADYRFIKSFIRVSRVINFLFGWMMPKGSKRANYVVEMDGSGLPNFKKESQ